MDVVYRFRSAEKLLDFKELERRQIYMARLDELNDPMEGYKDVVWRGDAVLWENLLRHYLLSMVWTASHCMLLSDDDFEAPTIPADLTEADLPTDAFRSLCGSIYSDFFSRPNMSTLSVQLSALHQHPRRDGLLLVLSLIHRDALAAVFGNLKKSGLMPPAFGDIVPSDVALEGVFKPFSKTASVPPEVDLETLAFAANAARRDQSLRMMFQLDRLAKAGGHKGSPRKTHYMVIGFPDRYIRSLIDGLIHPEWRAACFSGSCTNASSWGVYADGHRGVALVFRPSIENDQPPFIPLTGVTGTSQAKDSPPTFTRGRIKGHLHKVAYASQPPEIEFFQSLGTLPKKKLSAWHSSRSGERSAIIDESMKDMPAWRAAYWHSFHRATTTKLEDWKHEDEYRIVLADSFGLRAEKENAFVEYDFASLVGIVFGVQTRDAHKLAIMNEIASQCQAAGRKDFSFHQMAYSASQGRMLRL